MMMRDIIERNIKKAENFDFEDDKEGEIQRVLDCENNLEKIEPVIKFYNIHYDEKKWKDVKFIKRINL
jgi:hypothetical protein